MNYYSKHLFFSRLVLETLITVQYVHCMHISLLIISLVQLWLIGIHTMEKLERFLARKMSRTDEFKETGTLRNPSSGVESGKVFPESNPAVDNSGNDRIRNKG